MTMQDMLNDLIDKGLITPPTPDAVPHNPSNIPYFPTIMEHSIELRTPQEIEAAKKLTEAKNNHA